MLPIRTITPLIQSARRVRLLKPILAYGIAIDQGLMGSASVLLLTIRLTFQAVTRYARGQPWYSHDGPARSAQYFLEYPGLLDLPRITRKGVNVNYMEKWAMTSIDDYSIESLPMGGELKYL